MRDLHKGSTVVSSPASPPPTAPPVSPSLLNRLSASLRHTVMLMKPVTWFAPTWAFLCGAVASGALEWSLPIIGLLAFGMVMSGPILCGLSQVVNDYCDRDVDAINEPQRLIPSGAVSTRHVQILVFFLTLIGASMALFLGREVALFVGIGLMFAFAYSLRPIRAKRNGWFGNALVSFSYEGLAWLAGHAAFGALTWPSLIIAGVYSIGAHGIMTVNDFKSMEGDAKMGLRSIPVMYGKRVAAQMVVGTMALAQIVIIGALFVWGSPVAASVIAVLLLIQVVPFVRFVRDPENNAVFFNATAIMLFVWGMMAAAIGLAV